MIAHLDGTLLQNLPGHWTIGIGQPGSRVGYAVQVPQNHAYLSLLTGQSVELLIYTHVREDQLSLFGFLTPEEKQIFLLLLNVNGIGPKVAMGILSATEPALFIRAVLTGDKAFLGSLQGVGKKTAERLILEMKDSLKKHIPMTDLGASGSASSAVAQSAAPGEEMPLLWAQCRQALVDFGYKEFEIETAVAHLKKEIPSPTRVEELVKAALRRLSHHL